MQLNSSNIARVDAACCAVSRLLDTSAFRSRFSEVSLLRSAEEIEAARQNLPIDFLPFMTEHQPDSIDVYAFDMGLKSRDAVVVWNDHAVVYEWKNFEEFIDWLRGDSVVV